MPGFLALPEGLLLRGLPLLPLLGGLPPLLLLPGMSPEPADVISKLCRCLPGVLLLLLLLLWRDHVLLILPLVLGQLHGVCRARGRKVCVTSAAQGEIGQGYRCTNLIARAQVVHACDVSIQHIALRNIADDHHMHYPEAHMSFAAGMTLSAGK